MRQKYETSTKIPEGINCKVEDNILRLEKEGKIAERKISTLDTDVKISEHKIKISCEKANKKNIAMIRSFLAHINNMLRGLDNSFTYKLEICNVHFPMVVKVEGNQVVINGFLGEKTPRFAKIVEGVSVEVKGNVVTVSGQDIEKAGQTAANIEKASRVPKKDRRVFQDGIFMTEKPRGKI